jgi:hypothetical protein
MFLANSAAFGNQVSRERWPLQCYPKVDPVTGALSTRAEIENFEL